MYSINRNVIPSARQRAAIGRAAVSLTPCCSTVLTLTRNPQARAARMLSQMTCGSTGRPATALAMSGSSASRLTLTRSNPAACRAAASDPSARPLVVNARSSDGSSPRRLATRTGRSLRRSGSPPVIRMLRTPRSTNAAAMLVISS